jgi:hypothetical protein
MQTVLGEFWEPDAITTNDVQQARSEYQAAKGLLGNAEIQLSKVVERESRLTVNLKNAERVRRVRRLCDAWTTRVGALIILMFCSSMLVLIPCHVVDLPRSVWPIPFLAGLALAGFFGMKLFKPDEAKIASDAWVWNSELHSIQGARWGLEAEAHEAQSRADKAKAKYQSVLTHFQSRINRLRSTNWEVLQGIPFEQFLESVFAEWGYQVETTKTTGDQGVDLVVAKNGVRTAVQAKGYPNSTVGNSAVQEADTGMRFYRCNRSAVITNSTFTSHARRLAQGVGCTLIDHDMIPSLIEGKIPL